MIAPTDMSADTRTCFACSPEREATDLAWILGTYYYACREHSTPRPAHVPRAVFLEAGERLRGERP